MEKEQNRIWIGIVAIVLAMAALVVAGWLGRPAYHNYKVKRDATRAQTFYDHADYRNALLSTRQALQLDPSNLTACRIMVQLADLSRSPTALDWQRRLTELDPSVTNKIMLASLGLRYQDYPYALARQTLDAVAPEAAQLPMYQVVCAELALKSRRLAEAETHLAAALQLDPTNRQYAMNLAVVRLSSTNAVTLAAARATLEQFRTDPALGAAALRSLVADALAHGKTVSAQDYATQLLANAQCTLGDRLQYLGILRQRPGAAAELNHELQGLQMASATNAVAVAQVSGWMLANDRQGEVIPWLTGLPAETRNQAPFRLALANAYVAAGDWHGLRGYLTRDKWGELEFFRLAFLSRAWSQLGEGMVAGSTWRAAVSEAGNRYGALTALLDLADRWGMTQAREDLLERMVQQFPKEHWPEQELAQSYFASGDTAGLNWLFARMLAGSPDNLGLKNNLAATALLLRTNLPQACQWAAEVYHQKTNDATVASTYAYSLQLQGRADAGLAVMKKLDARQLAEPSVALYYGLLLTATGATNTAAHYLDIAAHDGHLLPEEKRLLAAARSPAGRAD